MFERFHQDARAAVAQARDEAADAGQQEVGTEHLLLGLLARPSHAADALHAAGVRAADLRARIPRGDAAQRDAPDADALAPAGADPDAAGLASGLTAGAGLPDQAGTGQRVAPDATGEVRLTSNARRAFELAQRQAERLRHHHVSPEHLLLGIIDQPGSQAVQALTVAGIHVGTLRADVLRRMTVSPDQGPP
ncbi:MAG: Clp protease N-terminal domain-containing protein [Streptosporangiaceae bacterium]|jgi:ATP-dependent Clp protease ATP-binding subunit ClpA